jgi:hypothetical protein
MSLQPNKAFCCHHNINNTEVQEGLSLKLKIREKKADSYSETVGRCRTPGYLNE